MKMDKVAGSGNDEFYTPNTQEWYTNDCLLHTKGDED